MITERVLKSLAPIYSAPSQSEVSHLLDQLEANEPAADKWAKESNKSDEFKLGLVCGLHALSMVFEVGVVKGVAMIPIVSPASIKAAADAGQDDGGMESFAKEQPWAYDVLSSTGMPEFVAGAAIFWGLLCTEARRKANKGLG